VDFGLTEEQEMLRATARQSTESVMSFRYRESIVATISGGTSQIQRNGIARSMGLRTY
jgi:hypothetical protein